MKTLLLAFLLFNVAFLGGCASSGPAKRKGAAVQGAPVPDVSTEVVDLVDPPGRMDNGPRYVMGAFPGELTVPATYRAQVIDGKYVLVRETDPRRILSSPSITVIAGDISGGDLAIQPALMPQEIAEEVTRNRVQTAELLRLLPEFRSQMDAMGKQAEELYRHNQVLAARLSEVAAAAHQLVTGKLPEDSSSAAENDTGDKDRNNEP
ncbi:hypothetical protein OPIT5_00050 (plasmid) [Opitutaceae bacterium TAV5]|nr:hypothetical protein OPIT5_00050 [Opitutaceae bacterium TAV5]